jgi:phthiocerol/phenolphthiocerol synthesis type-I polyketide synthase E
VVTTDVAPVGGPSRPEGSGVIGLLRTAAQELPQLAIRWVDVGGETAATTAAGQVLGELAGPVGDGLRVAAWRGDRRRTPALVAATASGSSPLRERGVYWITGGLGAVGRALALHLARRVRARLVLGGRTPLPERATWAERAADASDPAGRIVRDLLAIEAAGGEVLVTRADVAEALQVRAALREIEGRFGALHGVIHAAGVARDGLLRAKTPAQVREVLRPKWTGARCLLTALGERPLDFVALMGSLAGGVRQRRPERLRARQQPARRPGARAPGGGAPGRGPRLVVVVGRRDGGPGSRRRPAPAVSLPSRRRAPPRPSRRRCGWARRRW